MKIIVPMAGRGSRLRPHTLTTPKPLVPIAGVPIVHQLVRDIAALLEEPISEIAFILGEPAWFGKAVEDSLKALAKSLNAKATIYRQLEPKGTGHAILCAAPSLEGPAVIAYADTLIRASFNLNKEVDSVIWTKKVNNPQAYGVVKLNEKQEIIDLVEKPESFVSDEAVIGIYYFKQVDVLKQALEFVVNNKIIKGGEYQINDGILRMMGQGKTFKTATVTEWMDCGKKEVCLDTNAKMLAFKKSEGTLPEHTHLTKENTQIIEPCFIAEGVTLTNCVIGPYVSIGANTKIANSHVKNSIIQSQTTISNAQLENAMIGNHVIFNGAFSSVSLGDYSVLE